jgi:hypothetical protein
MHTRLHIGLFSLVACWFASIDSWPLPWKKTTRVRNHTYIRDKSRLLVGRTKSCRVQIHGHGHCLAAAAHAVMPAAPLQLLSEIGTGTCVPRYQSSVIFQELKFSLCCVTKGLLMPVSRELKFLSRGAAPGRFLLML